jgi:hypothetical protein
MKIFYEKYFDIVVLLKMMFIIENLNLRLQSDDKKQTFDYDIFIIIKKLKILSMLL